MFRIRPALIPVSNAAHLTSFFAPTSLLVRVTSQRSCAASASSSSSSAAPGKVKVTFNQKGKTVVCDATIGHTLLNVGLANRQDIEAACDGTCACSTCHCYIDDEHFQKLPKASDDEEDMLDLAAEQRHNSRLACQITVTKECDGMIVDLPEEVNSQLAS